MTFPVAHPDPVVQILKPPFSHSLRHFPHPESIFPTLRNEVSCDAQEKPSTASISHIPPAAVRSGNTLARLQDSPGMYYPSELCTTRLNDIKTYLWLAGVPSPARPLHRQVLLGRQIIITEDPNEHLIWHETRIFIKPLPTFLIDANCWTQKLCSDKQLHEAACGFLLSYAWLVRHESDLRIAHRSSLLPESITWAAWTAFIDDFLKHIDLHALAGISPRFQYGELRLSRLDKIYRWTKFKYVRGYMASSTWYQNFFATNFAWLLAFFAFLSVALSAMQVVVATSRGGQAFESVSYGFGVASLVVVGGVAGFVLCLWMGLFGYHLVRAWGNDRAVMRGRKGGSAC